jgi:hypothetical protein
VQACLNPRHMAEFVHEGFTVESKRVDSEPYVGLRGEVDLDELDDFIASSLAQLGVDEDEPYFVLYHDAVTPGSPAVVEVCRASDARDAQGELPAAELVYTLARDEQANYPRIAHAYDALTLWARKHGREVGGPAREAYVGRDTLEISKPLLPRG